MKKYKGMFYKKRILLLTDKARLVYLDPSNMQPKGEIPLDRELEVAVKSDHAFTVKHGKDSYVMDTQGQRDAVEWVESIKEMQAVGLKHLKTEDFLPWQHFMVFTK